MKAQNKINLHDYRDSKERELKLEIWAFIIGLVVSLGGASAAIGPDSWSNIFLLLPALVCFNYVVSYHEQGEKRIETAVDRLLELQNGEWR